MNINPISSSPNFSGHSRHIQTQIDRVITHPADSALNKKLADTIKLGLSSILTPEKFIEEGSHNAVYKITRKYALRLPREAKINSDELPQTVNSGKGIFSNIKSYFGEAILEMGKLQILKNVGHHRPAGVPEHLTKFFNKNKIYKYYLNTYLPRFAFIPQSSYDTLAKDINKLNEITLGPHRYCLFDSINPNNIVAKSGKLYLVDEIDTHCDRSYSNTSAKLLEIFINRATKDIDAPPAGVRLPLVRKIFKKVILASTKANLLHANSKWDYMNWQKALKKCSIKNDAAEVISSLEDIEYRYSNPEERVRKTKAYIDNLFVTNRLNR